MSEFSDRIVPMLHRGMPVWSEDGEVLGSVTDVRTGWFQVRRHGHRAFWLSADAVDQVRPDGITLLLPAVWVHNCASAYPRVA